MLQTRVCAAEERDMKWRWPKDRTRADLACVCATDLARWWGSPDSPEVFFPFVAMWGGLAQFIAGIFAFLARDTLTLVICSLWGGWCSLCISLQVCALLTSSPCAS